MTTFTQTNAWEIDEREFPFGGDSSCRYRFLLRYAALAPSSHNTQPWLFEVKNDGILMYADPTRALPVVDPNSRELTISCGCALEYLCVSARYFGYEPIVEYMTPNSQNELLARFSFGGRIEADQLEKALFKAIPDRRTNRNKYSDTEVPTIALQHMRLLTGVDFVSLQFISELSERKDIARMVSEGDRLQISDPGFRRELAAWVHHNRSSTRDGLPGYAFGISDSASILGPLVVRTFDWSKGQAARDEQLVIGSPLLAVLSTKTDTPTDWLNTGRALAEVLLFLTDQGLSASFLNQPIEVDDLRVALKKKLGDDGEPQILLRIGFGPPTQSTPRRPVEDMIIDKTQRRESK